MPRYVPRQIPALLCSPIGRVELANSALQASWPLLGRAATLYRRAVVRRTRLVTVVGSLGKTTTTHAVAAALGCGLQPMWRCNSKSFLASNLLSIRPGQRHAVIETGIARVGDMAPYARMLAPDLVVVTCIASEHNRSFGGLEVTRQQKAEMVRGLDPSSGVAVLNADDENAVWMASQTRAQVVTYGQAASADVRAVDARLEWPRGVTFELLLGGVFAPQRRQVRSRLLGAHQIGSLLAAAAVACSERLAIDQIVSRLEAVAPVAGRLQLERLPCGAQLLRDDFKSSLESIDRAFDLMEAIPAASCRRKLVVLGDVAEPPGSQGPIYRRLGGRLARFASRVVCVTSRKGRGAYAAGAARAGMSREDVTRATDVRDAAAQLRDDPFSNERLGDGDLVLVKGRTEQRLERVGLGLAGRQVACDVERCNVRKTACADCPMIERGWAGLPRVI